MTIEELRTGIESFCTVSDMAKLNTKNIKTNQVNMYLVDYTEDDKESLEALLTAYYDGEFTYLNYDTYAVGNAVKVSTCEKETE
jgi:hypothetical protein